MVWIQEPRRPVHLKLHTLILPDRVAIEGVDRIHVFIKVHVCGEGDVSVMGRLEVGDTAGGYPKTPQHWEQRHTHTQIHQN